jgi:hypothetical protein
MKALFGFSILFTNCFQEYGEGARARRLYENDSDEEDEKEAIVLKENPKLQQGIFPFLSFFLSFFLF